MKKVTMLAVIAVFGLMSCNSNADKKASEATVETSVEEVTHESNDAKYEIAELAFTENSKGILDAYFDVKEALQEDDAVGAKEEAAELLAALGAFTTTDEAAIALIEKMKQEVAGMASDDIKQQRAHFEPLSHQTKELLQVVGSDRVVYEQYCPMYNDNTGGMWLSEEEALLNPLFGDMMLRCGATKLEMKPVK